MAGKGSLAGRESAKSTSSTDVKVSNPCNPSSHPVLDWDVPWFSVTTPELG